MVGSLSVPVFHVGYTITTDALDQLYKQIKSKGVTMTALLAKAVAVTLQKHPLVNASYSDSGIVHHSGINVAVAVAMDDGGLITPVLQNADILDIYTLSRNWSLWWSVPGQNNSNRMNTAAVHLLFLIWGCLVSIDLMLFYHQDKAEFWRSGHLVRKLSLHLTECLVSSNKCK